LEERGGEERKKGRENGQKGNKTHPFRLLHVPKAPTNIRKNKSIAVLRTERVINPPRKVLRLVRTLQSSGDHTRRRVRLKDTFSGDLRGDGTDHCRGGLSDFLRALQGLLDEEGRVGDLTLVLGTAEGTAVEGVGTADVSRAEEEEG